MIAHTHAHLQVRIETKNECESRDILHEQATRKVHGRKETADDKKFQEILVRVHLANVAFFFDPACFPHGSWIVTSVVETSKRSVLRSSPTEEHPKDSEKPRDLQSQKAPGPAQATAISKLTRKGTQPNLFVHVCFPFSWVGALYACTIVLGSWAADTGLSPHGLAGAKRRHLELGTTRTLQHCSQNHSLLVAFGETMGTRRKRPRVDDHEIKVGIDFNRKLVSPTPIQLVQHAKAEVGQNPSRRPVELIRARIHTETGFTKSLRDSSKQQEEPCARIVPLPRRAYYSSSSHCDTRNRLNCLGTSVGVSNRLGHQLLKSVVVARNTVRCRKK